MSDPRQAALEALQYGKPNKAITILREALEQPEQEPVAWTTMPEAADWDFVSGSKDPTGKLEGKWFPLYTAPPAEQPEQRKPLTDVLVPLEVLEAAASSLDSFCGNLGWGDADLQNMDNLFAVIEQHKAAHNIKEGT